MAPSNQSAWPAWTNSPLTLFHGTTTAAAESVLAGVSLAYSKPFLDFGKGFYTTTVRSEAVLRAKSLAFERNEPPSLVELSLDRLTLGKLTDLAFVRSKMTAIDFWSFVAHCRLGFPHYGGEETGSFYDVVYGPVARTWNGLHDSSAWKHYDQINFHTPAAVAVLNNATTVCMKQVVAL